MTPLATRLIARISTLLVLCVGLAVGSLYAQPNPDFSGQWKMDTDRSTPLDPWRTLVLDIAVDGDSTSIVRNYAAGSRVASESMTLDTSLPSQIVETEGWWDNRHIGAYLGNDKKQTVAAKWLDEGMTLQLMIDLILETSQGDAPVRVIRELRLSDDGETLTVLQIRSSRNLPVVRVFTRS